jgi:predicted RNase H-like HicB family nuclease
MCSNKLTLNLLLRQTLLDAVTLMARGIVGSRQANIARQARITGRIVSMTGKVSVVIEQDEHDCYAWCPELKGCQSQGKTVEETLANIREAIELVLETLSDEERSAALSREILFATVQVVPKLPRLTAASKGSVK